MLYENEFSQAIVSRVCNSKVLFLKTLLASLLILSLFFLTANELKAAEADMQVPATSAGQQAPLNDTYAAVTPSAYQVNVVLATPLGSSSVKDRLQNAILNDLSFLPFIRIQDGSVIAGGITLDAASGPALNLERFKMSRTDNVITTMWINNQQVELRVFEVETQKFLLGTRMDLSKGASVEDLADEFCAQYMEMLTGRGDFFRSTLAFVKSNGKERRDIWIVKPTRGDARKVTNIPGDSLSPAWSRDGRFIVFSHIDERTHALGVWDSATNRVQRIRFPGNTVIGPAFMPDNKVLISLSDGKYPSVFLLNHAFQKEKRVTNSQSIDVSPSVDASGQKMVFTSSRLGNPHIFLQNLSSGDVTRISRDGKYNTDPSISPDGTMVVYARQMGGGHKIFVHDLRTGQEQQITFGAGSDEQPEFAPDSYFIAFTSTRSGSRQVYLTTRHGGTPKQLNTGSGDAAFPSWGLTKQ